MSQSTEIQNKDQFVHVAAVLLNKDSTNEDREKADQLLSQLYKTTQAWQICKEVLSVPANFEEITFITAKLLRVKLYYYFNELPETDYAELFLFIISKL